MHMRVRTQGCDMPLSLICTAWQWPGNSRIWPWAPRIWC